MPLPIKASPFSKRIGSFTRSNLYTFRQVTQSGFRPSQLSVSSRSFGTQPFRLPSSLALQRLSHGSTNIQWAIGLSAGALLLGGGLALRGEDDDPILNRPNPADRQALSKIPTSRLVGGWIVYAFCSSPTLIEMSEGLFNILHSVPVVSWLVDAFARRTFFAQFFAGETAEDSEPNVWAPLRQQSVGVLCGYNVEAKHDGTGVPATELAEIIRETLHSIAAVGAFGVKHSSPADVQNGDTRCWVRTKLTGLTTDPEVLQRASYEILAKRRDHSAYYPGVPADGDWEAMMSDRLSTKDHDNLVSLYSTLKEIMIQGQKYGVRIIIDAEQTWYQPAIDVFTEQLMREFNAGNGPPVVCATFQAYLRRNTDLINTQIERARTGNYKLIFKQVRGAYIPYEIEQWKRLGKAGPPPVFSTKIDTDKSYNYGIELGLRAIREKLDNPKAGDVAIILATHNEVSIDKAITFVEELGLGKKQEDGSLLISDFTANRLAFAQIYGMKDSLTNRAAASIKAENGLPVVCKSAAYGTLDNALPNLSRRAVENKTVMEGRGGASTERKRLARELCRRWVPLYSRD
ncbi:uncharacterized protein IAS62_005833 [Cryptococcus decagattii]|uniref:Proline dehydrogenase n=1 Tax=Cryptococcus decagattii TaxID=1859122 RepID=A0ABZ2B6S4_9TREE